MRIRRLKIENFRGIKLLDWKLPVEQRLVVLVGPGDSGKSTILEAIHYLLGDRWNIPFSDTDFFQVNVDEPISIKAVLVDLPPVLKKENAFGLWLSGVDSDGKVYQDPDDEHEVALIAKLTVDASLEPKWTVERADGQNQSLSAEQRRSFSTFKVDDRNDTQLRWTRTSALGRMSARDGGDLDALAAASRAARDALAAHENSSLADLAKQVQDRANKIGSGRFADIKPGLDTSRSSMGAGLALYEDVIPLTSFGLGSRRLASFAVQQLAAGSRAVAVVDELEDGLEPHRAVKLLGYLLTDEDYSQVVVTTHSPVIVEQAKTENLGVVQSVNGQVTVTSISGTSLMRRLQRSRPSSFLARRVLVVEGKTEHGLMLALLDAWDAERTERGLSSSAGEGVAIQDGEGGSEVAIRAIGLSKIGIVAGGFMDNDVRDADKAVTKAGKLGIPIVRWDLGNNTEKQITEHLDVAELDSLIEVAAAQRSGERTVLNDLHEIRPTLTVTTLNIQDWLDGGVVTIEEAREAISVTAHEKDWFRLVDGGRALGDWLLEHLDSPNLARVAEVVTELRNFVFPPVLTEHEAAVNGDEPSDG